MSASPWARPARPPRPRRATWCCWSIGWTGWRRRSGSPAARAASRCGPSRSGWGCPAWRWRWRRPAGLPPLAGALVQEAIDVLAILYALTALRPGPDEAGPEACRLRPGLAERQAEHAGLRAARGRVARRGRGDRRDAGGAARAGVVELRLRAELLPHQREEERALYPEAARRLGGQDPMAPLIRMHAEIEALVERMAELLRLGRTRTLGTAAPELAARSLRAGGAAAPAPDGGGGDAGRHPGRAGPPCAAPRNRTDRFGPGGGLTPEAPRGEAARQVTRSLAPRLASRAGGRGQGGRPPPP